MVLHKVIDDDGQTGGRTTDLKWSSREAADNQATDNAGDQTGRNRDARGNSDAHAER